MKGENLFSLGMLYHIAMESGWKKWWGNLIIRIIEATPLPNFWLFHEGWVKAGQWLYW